MAHQAGIGRVVGLTAALLTTMTVVPCFSAVQQPDRPEQSAQVKQASGEVAAVDLALGRLTLREIADGRSAETQDYALSARDTAVTDPLDKQFLKLEGLQPGYRVRVDYAVVDGQRLAKKITVDSVNDLRWAVGTVSAMDARRNTLWISQERPAGSVGSSVITQYETDSGTQVMDLAERRFISLGEIQPGDLVQVEFTLKNGKRVARLISNLEQMEPQIAWTSGRIEAVDLDAGILVISERIPRWNYSERVNYVVDLDQTRIVDLRGRRFLALDDLLPGQPVRLQFIESPVGQRSVQCVVVKP